MSGISARAARDTIRSTWFRWPAFADSAVGCFVLARRGALLELTHPDEGDGRVNDLLWLDQATEGCGGISVSKALAYRTWAATLPTSVTHVVKTEDDAVVVLPNLMATLSAWRHARGAYLGGFAHAGFHYRRLKMCGFEWARADATFGGTNAVVDGSEAYPAVPFAQGRWSCQLTL